MGHEKAVLGGDNNGLFANGRDWLDGLFSDPEFTNEAMVRQALGAAAVQQLGEELAGEWPQWRGPRRDGQVDAETAARLVLG